MCNLNNNYYKQDLISIILTKIIFIQIIDLSIDSSYVIYKNQSDVIMLTGNINISERLFKFMVNHKLSQTSCYAYTNPEFNITLGFYLDQNYNIKQLEKLVYERVL